MCISRYERRAMLRNGLRSTKNDLLRAISLEFLTSPCCSICLTPPTLWYPFEQLRWGRLRRLSSVGSSGPGLLLRAIVAALARASCPGAWKKNIPLKAGSKQLDNVKIPNFQSMLCSQACTFYASSSILIDISSVRPISLQPRLFPLSGQHISPLPVVPTSEQTQVEDACWNVSPIQSSTIFWWQSFQETA